MSRSIMLSIVGTVIALTPFSGLPQSILLWVVPPLGILVVVIGLSYKRQVPKKFVHSEPPNVYHDGA